MSHVIDLQVVHLIPDQQLVHVTLPVTFTTSSSQTKVLTLQPAPPVYLHLHHVKFHHVSKSGTSWKHLKSSHFCACKCFWRLRPPVFLLCVSICVLCTFRTASHHTLVCLCVYSSAQLVSESHSCRCRRYRTQWCWQWSRSIRPCSCPCVCLAVSCWPWPRYRRATPAAPTPRDLPVRQVDTHTTHTQALSKQTQNKCSYTVVSKFRHIGTCWRKKERCATVMYLTVKIML